MSFTKRLLLLAIISILLTLGYLFGFKKPAESAINKELVRFTEELESRNAGSSLTYGEPTVSGKSVSLTNVQYIDGKSDIRYDIGDLNAELLINGTYNGSANNITITPNKGHAYTIASVNLLGYDDKTPNVEFDELTLIAVNLTGQLSKFVNTNMQIGMVKFTDVRNDKLGVVDLHNITMGNDLAPAALNLAELQLNDLNYADLIDTVENLREGKLPLHLIPMSNLNDVDMNGLNKLLGDNSSGNDNGLVNTGDLFDFFLKNAPEELQDFVGSTDGQELADQLQELQDLPPEDQTIKGLEFLLEILKDNKNN